MTSAAGTRPRYARGGHQQNATAAAGLHVRHQSSLSRTSLYSNERRRGRHDAEQCTVGRCCSSCSRGGHSRFFNGGPSGPLQASYTPLCSTSLLVRQWIRRTTTNDTGPGEKTIRHRCDLSIVQHSENINDDARPPITTAERGRRQSCTKGSRIQLIRSKIDK